MSLRHALLVLLAERPHTGYELTRRMQETVALFWTARHSQIYPELAAMEASGLVHFEASSGPGPREKKTYTITADGRDVLRAWLSAPHRPRQPKDELVLSAFAASAADQTALAARCRGEMERLDAKLTEYVEIQRQLESMPETDDPSEPAFGWHLSLLHGLAAARARRDWCADVIARLERATSR